MFGCKKLITKIKLKTIYHVKVSYISSSLKKSSLLIINRINIEKKNSEYFTNSELKRNISYSVQLIR